MTTDLTDLILGTAGHIDHGKTSLVRALTGVDTDRLPEEKKRGITIDLGFAELDLGDVRLGIVDVPGHERFVRNMLAGATGIDLALLVVAADDSVDAADPRAPGDPQAPGPAGGRDRPDEVRPASTRAGSTWSRRKSRSLVAGHVPGRAPIVRTSRRRPGRGSTSCKAALRGRCRAGGGTQNRGPFRMADRPRVHGRRARDGRHRDSVSSGRVRVGRRAADGARRAARAACAGLQNHDRPVEEVHRGQRAAINLAGVHHDEIRRGQELAGAGPPRPQQVAHGSTDAAHVDARGRRSIARGSASIWARRS